MVGSQRYTGFGRSLVNRLRIYDPRQGIGQNFSYLQCSETEVRTQGPLCIAHFASCLESTFCYHWLFGVKTNISACDLFVATKDESGKLNSANTVSLRKGKMENILCATSLLKVNRIHSCSET
ncbi:hypothetical protein chiPu_0010298 [Chiloscyllium punctatum]|uniref:Uncharacterized protein n=1 Tax=Chiloscyllium punctatum TaxID=137246 RepID=A0A401SN82_CHIPU|nr:hypothetical protein [Chiloscyllium punctatum]